MSCLVFLCVVTAWHREPDNKYTPFSAEKVGNCTRGPNRAVFLVAQKIKKNPEKAQTKHKKHEREVGLNPVAEPHLFPLCRGISGEEAFMLVDGQSRRNQCFPFFLGSHKSNLILMPIMKKKVLNDE